MMAKRTMTPVERIDEHIRLFQENDHYPWIDFKTGTGRFVNVGTHGDVEQLGESELVRLVMLGKVATQLLPKHITMLTKEEFIAALRNLNFTPAKTPRPPLSLKRYSLHPDASKLACHWMIEEAGGPWVRFTDLEPVEKGGLSVKAATQIDALLQSSINIPAAHDPLAWEVHQFDRLMFGITEDIKQSIRAGKMKRMTEVEREHFYSLLTAFLRHQLKS